MNRVNLILALGLFFIVAASAMAAGEGPGVSASEAVQILKDGNARFAGGTMQFPNLDQARMQETVSSQHPFASVLTCSDSRVPVEDIFDCGIGDVFVIRVAGNVAGIDETGSIEYAAEHLKTPLLVVLGHTNCGAVTAAATHAEVSGAMEKLVSRITPVVDHVSAATPNLSGKKLVAAVIKANVWQSIEDLLNESPAICKMVKSGELTIKGAVYHIEDGTVEWLGQHPKQTQLVEARLAMPETPATPTTAAVTTDQQEAKSAAPAANQTTIAEKSKLGQALDKLQATVSGQPQPAPASVAQSDQSQTALRQEIDQLRAQLNSMQAAIAANKASESTLVRLTTDLEVAKAQIAQMQSSGAVSGRKLASTDDQDMTGSPAYAELDRLASLVTELNTRIEKSKTANSQPAQNSPSVNHGSIALTGLIHQQYYNLGGTQKKSTFDNKRARLGVSGTLNSYAKINILGEFAKTPALLDGYLAITPGKSWLVRVGQFWPSVCSDYMRSAAALPFVNYSLAAPLATNRDIGASVAYSQTVSKKFAYSLITGIYNGSGINTNDANTNKNMSVRGEAKIAGMLTLAPAWYVGKTNDTGTSRHNINTWSSSASWQWKSEIVEAEYIHSRVANVDKAGWYVWGGHTIATGFKFLPQVQPCVRYEQYDPSRSAINDKVTRVTLGTNFFIDTKYTMIQLNYQINGEEGTSISNNEFLANFQVTF
ncbi:MAG TPA: porin [Candidatus Acidoferrum sp.]|nr:porin [Candidatus Acidoferrum sp.]